MYYEQFESCAFVFQNSQIWNFCLYFLFSPPLLEINSFIPLVFLMLLFTFRFFFSQLVLIFRGFSLFLSFFSLVLRIMDLNQEPSLS